MRFVELEVDELPALSRLVLFASYEPRALAVARRFSEAHFGGQVVVLYCADAATPRVAGCLDAMRQLFPERRTEIPLSVHNPEPAITVGRALSGDETTLVDVTCFTRENLFSMLWGLQLGVAKKAPVTFAYTPARSYGPWLTRQYRNPHNMVGFGGAAGRDSLRSLICIVGFDGDRAIALLKYLEPNRVVLGIGGNPTRAEFLARNEAALKQVLEFQRYEVLDLPVNEPEPLRQRLEEIVEGLKGPGTTHLAPFNTKRSCLAAYSCWLRNPSLRIWNVLPTTYNFRGYSEGEGDSRYFGIDWRK